MRPKRPHGLWHLAIGLAAATVLALAGHRGLALLPLAIGLGAATLAAFSPGRLLRLEALAQRFGLLVGRGLALVLIGAAMLLVFAPAGLLLRWRGKLRMAVKPNPGPNGYWRSPDRFALSDYRRQF